MSRFSPKIVQLIVEIKQNHFSEYINLILAISTVVGVLFAILSPLRDAKKRKNSINDLIIKELEFNTKVLSSSKESVYYDDKITILRNLQAGVWETFKSQIGTLFDGNILKVLYPYYSRLLAFIGEINLQSIRQNSVSEKQHNDPRIAFKLPENFNMSTQAFADNTPKIIDIIKNGNKSDYYSDPSLLEFLTLEPNASDYGIKLNEAIPEPANEVTPEPAIEVTPEPAIEVTPEPAIEAIPEPAIEAIPEPLLESSKY